jgi:hypothetical protein
MTDSASVLLALYFYALQVQLRQMRQCVVSMQHKCLAVMMAWPGLAVQMFPCWHKLLIISVRKRHEPDEPAHVRVSLAALPRRTTLSRSCCCCCCCRVDLSPASYNCDNGACVCPAGTQECNGLCVDATSDLANCGRCGNVSGTGAAAV